MHFAIDVGLRRVGLHSLAAIDDLNFEDVIACGKDDANRELFIEAIAVFDGVDACLGNGRFQIFNSIGAQTYELGDSGGGAHRDLLIAESRRKPYLNRRGFLLAHSDDSVRQSVSAVISSDCGPPSEKA